MTTPTPDFLRNLAAAESPDYSRAEADILAMLQSEAKTLKECANIAMTANNPLWRSFIKGGWRINEYCLWIEQGKHRTAAFDALADEMEK